MSYPGFEDAIRRVVTGDDADGKSIVIIDGGPGAAMAEAGLGGLLDIWADTHGPLDPKDHTPADLEPVNLHPPKGGVKVRWFVIEPTPPGVPKEILDKATREAFGRFHAADAIIDQSRASGMHETHSIDVICLIKGEASLILEDDERRLKPGNIVIQRATNHAWIAHGGPALFLAVLIDREVVRR
ncbi:MAG: cupin domain-containing protein [Alphaproteobacteria bacterium]|nr:cupin domain-containing protein [Alphaproteobacteria bacterium]